jgi:hypothetical protein
MADSEVVIAAHLEARQRAKTTDRLKQTLYVLAAAGAVACAGSLIEPLNTERADLHIEFNPDIFKQVPPDVAMLSTTLGPLRGLWIYTLWIQADKLKEEKRFYDALQRAQWICKLQPRFPDVWVFQAWNMAYNISVTKHTPQERWQWVRNGLMLLIRQGIPLNPRSEMLYKEAAWIFFHKMGDQQDDMHWVYKKEWATEMQRVLGRPEYGLSTAETIDRFRPIAETTPNIELLERQDAGVATLVRALAELGYDPDHGLLTAYHDATFRRDAMHIAKEPDSVMSKQDAALLALLDAPENSQAAAKLLAAVRHKVLQDEYNMDPAWMLKLMEKYGPLDWRVVFASSLYWATKGEEMATNPALTTEHVQLQRDRLIPFSLKGLFQTGRIMFTPDLDDPGQSFLAQFSDMRFIDAVHQEYIAYGQKLDPEAAEGTAGYFMSTGHVNALHEAIRTLFVRGSAYPEDMKKAEQLYAYLRDHYRQPDGSPKPEYLQRLPEWVAKDFRSMAERSKTVVELLSGFFDAELLALAMGNAKEARAFLARAEQVYDIYMEDKVDAPSDRMSLLHFGNLHRQAIMRFFIFGQVPIPYKVRVWDNLPTELQQGVYDGSIEALSAQCEATGYDVTKAFREPPGMDAYRKAHPEPDKEMYIPEAPEPAPKAPTLELEVVEPNG